MLFLRWDRYSRDIISASENLKELLKLGIEPNAIEAPLDFNSDTWPLLLGVHIGSAQCDNIKRSKATMDGIHGTLAKENALIKHQEDIRMCALANMKPM